MSAQAALDAADNQLAEDGAHEADPLPLRVLRSVVARGKPIDWDVIAPPRPPILKGARPSGWEYDPAASAIGVDE